MAATTIGVLADYVRRWLTFAYRPSADDESASDGIDSEALTVRTHRVVIAALDPWLACQPDQ